MDSRTAALLAAAPDLDPAFIAQHVARLGERYFTSFPPDDQLRHVKHLAALTAEQPAAVLITDLGEGRVGCTVLAFDYAGEFSLLAGILTGAGFNIQSGEIFTYTPLPAGKPQRHSRTRRRSAPAPVDTARRRRIIDYFSGTVDSELPFDAWAENLRTRIQATIRLLETGTPEAVTEAKHLVNEMVADRLAALSIDSHRILMPMQITLDNEAGPCTRLALSSEDSTGFLYAFSTALALRGIIIERVVIRTVGTRIEDEFDFVDAAGNKITDPRLLDQIKLSVLLTKQFTYFLGSAPDPYTALSRFESMVDDILRMPEQGGWVDFLSNPQVLRDLARLLGASDFMWEDFIHLQYESLIPMLQPEIGSPAGPVNDGTLEQRLQETLTGTASFEELRDRLNRFKDNEIFRIDLDHILNPRTGFRTLAERLTILAEKVVLAAIRIVYQELAGRYGTPLTVAGLDTRLAVCALGKFGGAALGYASDIELLFVYSDNGQTAGPENIDNAEFFDRLVKEVNRFILAKRQGIFTIDLRLRPFGQDGPLASSLENFCRYYGPGGAAHAYERLALVRLRAIGGDADLGAQIERIRDEFIYVSKTVDIPQLRELRQKQFREKTGDGRINAKFSPGALVDIEYDVQVLQVIYGKDIVDLRTPRIHEALENLQHHRVLEQDEAERLAKAYDFFRILINGLRMLRGSAQDLFLPDADADEYAHLARRMGYRRGDQLSPEGQLHIEFEAHSAEVRAFVERHFGRDTLPGPAVGTVADLVLSSGVPRELRDRILHDAGFTDADRAYINLRSMTRDKKQSDMFARLAVLVFDILKRTADPDRALNNWERFTRTIKDTGNHYRMLLSQPRRADILLTLFASSQFLADTLIQSPAFLEWTTRTENLRRTYTPEDFAHELSDFSKDTGDHEAWLDHLRSMKRRETLRIGTRDMCLGIPMPDIARDLSVAADGFIQAALARTWERMDDRQAAAELAPRFCIAAMGKLGGNELNYSSDIDLIGLFADENSTRKELFGTVMEQTCADLARHTAGGYVYRVDLRLRPYGRAGELVHSCTNLAEYYTDKAGLWEIQALLKFRPVAGNPDVGRDLYDRLRPLLCKGYEAETIRQSIRHMLAQARQVRPGSEGIDIKTGPGGLRDIEFTLQALQLRHAPDYDDILYGNTLQALAVMGEHNIIDAESARQIRDDYIFLRQVEHCLQILEDRQIHTVPADQVQHRALARRLLGSNAGADQFKHRLDECLQRVTAFSISYL